MKWSITMDDVKVLGSVGGYDLLECASNVAAWLSDNRHSYTTFDTVIVKINYHNSLGMYVGIITVRGT